MNPDTIHGLVQAAESGTISPWLLTICFVVGTFISEDLTCVAAGLLVAHGIIGYGPAMLASLLGIYLGDLCLYAGGRFLGNTLLRRRSWRRVLPPEKIQASEDWFARRGPSVILISRFVPGSRLPVYVAAGVLRLPIRRVALYFGLAGVLWTPALVAVSMVVGGRILAWLETYGQVARWVAVATALLIWLCIRLAFPLFTWRGRRLLYGRFQRLMRWEFWPTWALYPPVLLSMLRSAWRHRCATAFTAANPAMPASGVVGESKTAILDGLGRDHPCVARFALLDSSVDPAVRLASFASAMTRLGFSYPVVLKPDQGQRGDGVVVIRSVEEAHAYLAESRRQLMVQEYVPGREFGVFYVRLPSDERGRIFSVTEKRMPVLVGDGTHTLEQLILRDARAVCLAELYLGKNRARSQAVIPAGEPFQLVEIGNHCRGAIFLNGAWVVTPQLEAAIDRIGRGFSGFYFGRFDLRTSSVEDLRAGRNFKIIELNGVTSEATHIYDPTVRLFAAQRTLMAQWRLAYEIGSQNRARGAATVSLRGLWRLYRAFRKSVARAS